MAHLPVEGEDEHYYDMITVSPPPMEFGDFAQAPMGDAKAFREHAALGSIPSAPDYSSLFGQSSSLFAPKHPSSQRPDFPNDSKQEFPYDPVMFANPNQTTKVESPDLLSPTSMGTGFRSHNSDFLTTQSLYSDAASNANSLFHDAASHFSGAAEPPATFFEASAQHPDTFSQEITLGGSISSTNLTEMHAGHGLYPETVYPRNDYLNTQKYYGTDYQNDTGPHLNDIGLNQENWRYDYTQQNQGNTYSVLNQYESSNKLTEDNLSNYNGKLEDAKVTISIHQAPDQVAAHTPSLFSNSSHNSSPNKQNFTGNQLQPPGQKTRSRSSSLSLNPQSPAQSWNHTSSPALTSSLPSPGGSVYSDVEAESFLKPEDYQNMRRGRQTAHHLKVRSQSHSRSRSRSGSVSAHSDNYDESELDNVDPDDEAVKSSREKMLELASSASVSKRTQIHPSSYACHLCEKKFTRPYNLKSHLRTHTDDRPFICNICGKAFARQHDRKRHEELHSGEKKYQCRGLLRSGEPFGCGRKFARADALRRHFQTESGKECIKLLVEEDAREQHTGILNSGIQLPDGEFMNPNAPDLPVLSVSPPQED